MKIRWVIFSMMVLLLTAMATPLAGQYNDHDRQVTKEYIDKHHDSLPAGLKEEERKPENEEHLKAGVVLAPELRREVHPVPPALAHNLSKPPAGCKHVAVSGHVVLVDKKYVVKDVIHPEH